MFALTSTVARAVAYPSIFETARFRAIAGSGRAGIVVGFSQTPTPFGVVFDEEKRPVRLTAKQAPHRPGISSALGLRAGGDDFLLIQQTISGKHAHYVSAFADASPGGVALAPKQVNKSRF